MSTPDLLSTRPAGLPQPRRYPGINWVGVITLYQREVRRFWKVGAAEVWRDAVKSAFVKDLQRYVPETRSQDLVFGPSGVRAQAVGRDGALVDDFTLAKTARSLHVLNAPSPAATASLSIAGLLAEEAADLFDLTAGRRSTRLAVVPGLEPSTARSSR